MDVWLWRFRGLGFRDLGIWGLGFMDLGFRVWFGVIGQRALRGLRGFCLGFRGLGVKVEGFAA